MKNSIMAIVALCAMNALAAVYDVASPDGTLTANVTVGDMLAYSITKNGRTRGAKSFNASNLGC